MSDHPRGLHHVGIVVHDLEAGFAWHQQHLSFERLYDVAFAGSRALMIARGSLRLDLFETDGAKPLGSEREAFETNLKIGGINHPAMDVDDLDGALAALQESGVEVAAPPSDVPNGSGDRFAFLRDDEGMLFELFQAAS